jgi:phosphate transport system permease protein
MAAWFLPSRPKNRADYDRRRRIIDKNLSRGLYLLTVLPVLLVLALFLTLLIRSWPLLSVKPLWQLLSDQTWLPSQGQFNFLPFISGTLWVTITALIIAVPPCLLVTIYLSEYAHRVIREMMKPVLDLLAAIPSVVYGVWGVLVVVPWVKDFSVFSKAHLGFIPFLSSQNPTGFSILAGSIVLAIMIGPFIISMGFEVLCAVPDGYREASLSVGATRWETIKFVLIPKTTSGIIAAIVMGASRALGETMAVLMVVGNVAHLPGSIFDSAYPLPALIANNFGEMLSIPLYDSALMTAAFILLILVLIFNIFASLMLRRIIQREKFQ